MVSSRQTGDTKNAEVNLNGVIRGSNVNLRA